MENFLKLIAGFFAILFIGATALTLALFSVEQSVFDANLYVRALDEENFYQRLPDLAAQSLASAAQKSDRNDMLSLFKNLSVEEWRIFITELFPPEVLRSLAEDAVTQIIAYLNGERENAILSLTDLKAHLQSPEGVNAIYGIIKSQPDCSVEQLTAMAMGHEDMLLCNPPESFLFIDLGPIYEANIRASLAVLPEQVTLISAGESQIQTLRDLRALRLFMRLSPLLPFLCLLAITVLAVRSLNDWLTWWGYPFLLAGLISMSLGAVSGSMAALTFRIFIASVLPDAFPPEIIDVFRDLTAAIVRNAVRPTLLAAGLLALIGLIMVALTFLLRKRLHTR